jgi:hypothetical protein
MRTILFALCALVFIASCASLPSIIRWENEQNKDQRFSDCVWENGSDTGCDSCFYHIYGYFDTNSYSSGHYNPNN